MRAGQENLQFKLSSLSQLSENLKKAVSLPEKIRILNSEKKIQGPVEIQSLLSQLSEERRYILKQLVLLDQIPVVFPQKFKKIPLKNIEKFLDDLLEIDQFYHEIGGLIGYHLTILRFLQTPISKKTDLPERKLFPPSFIKISDDESVRKMVLWGIEHLPEISELYPLGGAADRLHLQDPVSKAELPAAKLHFGGKTLLEWLIQDLQAKEYLYFKLHGKEIITPIAMMTSHEKNNYSHIMAICEENGWFGRPKESIKLFLQPLVPTITHEGKWCMKEPLQPLLKPSGHGAIWKLAKDFGILQWLKKKKRKKALIRQINNPIAGIDLGLLAFTGYGMHHDQNFGFASCARETGAAEGINVLVEKKTDEGYSYNLSNIEYCDFERFGIVDDPKQGKYSPFSSNTNILFADLKAVEKAAKKSPFPGVLINLKEIRFPGPKGMKEEKVARLESTMQNIADEFVETYPKALPKKNRKLRKTFITFNERHRTISTAKKVYFPGKPNLETPERCFYDLLKNAYELLLLSGFSLPALPTLDAYLQDGPSFIFRYHPALGPLFSVIRQKLNGGKIHLRSEMVLDLSELFIENLDLQGSLIVQAKHPTGHIDNSGLLHSSNQSGKCYLKNVRMINSGIEMQGPYWKNISRKESVTILLQDNAEFIAENVTLQGNHLFEVEAGTQLRVFEKGGKILRKIKSLSAPTWFWKYEVQKDSSILLKH